MRHLLKCAALFGAIVAAATAADAQTVKVDIITTFTDVGNGVPNEVAPGPGGKLYAISSFSSTTSVAILRIDPALHTQSIVRTLDLGQTNPSASRLVLAPDGQFYASFIADQGGGLLRFNPSNNAAAVIRTFGFDPGTGMPGPDGTYPTALTLGRNGSLYGMMSLSSTDAFESGSLFSFDPVTGTFLTLHSFELDIDGAYASAPLVEGADGVFYGSNSDMTSCGSAFKFDTQTTILTTLHTFDLSAEGCGPGGFGVLPDGRIVGITTSGTYDGVDPNTTTGGVFAMDADSGAVTPLHMFLLGDGISPIFPGNVTVSPGGNIYVLGQNFVLGNASVFRVNPLTNSTQDIQDLPNLEIGALTVGREGRLYGVADSTTLFALGVLDPLPVASATGLSGGTTTLSTTLKALGVPLAGRQIAFTLNGNPAGSATTDANGVATLTASLVGIAAGSYPDGVGASFAGDAKFPATSGTGVLSVLAAATPGLMVGDGFLTTSDMLRYDFKFVVQENANSVDKGKLELRVTDVDDGHKKKVKRNDVFKSTSYSAVVFTLDSAVPPAFDTVNFAGDGTWNGVAGYHFVASALDYLSGGRHSETLAITIYDPSNNVVATVNGVIRGGNLRSRRIHKD